MTSPVEYSRARTADGAVRDALAGKRYDPMPIVRAIEAIQARWADDNLRRAEVLAGIARGAYEMEEH